MLSEQTADNILAMIVDQKRFSSGDKLPNENVLAKELGVSRTTLREAIRILMAHNIVEIRRGNGTFVCNVKDLDVNFSLSSMETARVQIRDLLEMRLVFEPEIAYLAALRGTDKELDRILYYGRLDEQLMKEHSDSTAYEQAFHNSIAKATHNEFMKQLMPIINEAVHKAVLLAGERPIVFETTIQDHRMLMDFLQRRDADGAKTAMRMHILHMIQGFEIDK